MRAIYKIALVLILSAACSAKIDQSKVKASNDIPEAAKVEEVYLAYEINKPLIYLTVEPILVKELVSESKISFESGFENSSKEKLHGNTTKNSKKKPTAESNISTTNRDASITESAKGNSSTVINLQHYRNYFLSRQRQITSQLNSSLAGIKNFKLLDYEINKSNSFNFTKQKNSDLGPYVVRAVITECNDQVKYQKDKSIVPLFYSDRDIEIVKMIGLDIQILDPKTGEVIEGFPVQGSYTYKDVSVEGGFIADFSTSKLIVQSSIDQALRVALNDAARKLSNRLVLSNN